LGEPVYQQLLLICRNLFHFGTFFVGCPAGKTNILGYFIIYQTSPTFEL